MAYKSIVDPPSDDGPMTAISNQNRTWHTATVDEAMAAQDSGPFGLTETQAIARLTTFGPNRLPAPKRRGPLLRFLAQFNDALVLLLLAAAAITAALGHGIDSGVILAVVLVNAVIGYIQEGKAEKGPGRHPQHACPQGKRDPRRTSKGCRRRRRCAWRHRAARGGRSGACRSPSDRCQRAQDRRSGADRRVDGRRQSRRRRGRTGVAWRSHVDGVQRHARDLWPRQRPGGRYRRQDRDRSDQRHADRGHQARNATPAPDERVRDLDGGRDPLPGDPGAVLRPAGPRLQLFRDLHGGRRPVGRRHPRRPAGDPHHHPCDRRSGHGAPQRLDTTCCPPSRLWAQCRSSAPTRPAP